MMERNKSQGKYSMGRESSMAPQGHRDSSPEREFNSSEVESGVKLMYLANEGDLEGVNEALDSGIDVNFRDIDSRTALHVAACQGHPEVVELLIKRGAEVDPKDRWGSTPLADAIYYKNQSIIKLLEKFGAKPPIAPMHVESTREIPEYEIDPSELDFSNSVGITKGTYCIASWRGIQVAVKVLGDDLIMDEERVEAFKDELALLQQIRHPNVVQFLGAVTQSTPMMIVTEFLRKGDLRAYLDQKHPLKLLLAVKLALDIARGMNYLHEHKPEAIIHRDLEPSNILRDDTGHLKVADFGVSKLLKVTNTVREERPVPGQETSWRYMAPEVFRNEEYDTKVDVFSFALIFQEMIEGCPPFALKSEEEVSKAYCANERPPFVAPAKCYRYGIKELIEQCWNEKPFMRPTFRQIISKLEEVEKSLDHRRHVKVVLGCCGFIGRSQGRKESDSSSHFI